MKTVLIMFFPFVLAFFFAFVFYFLNHEPQVIVGECNNPVCDVPPVVEQRGNQRTISTHTPCNTPTVVEAANTTKFFDIRCMNLGKCRSCYTQDRGHVIVCGE